MVRRPDSDGSRETDSHLSGLFEDARRPPTIDVVLSQPDVVQPDIVFVAGTNRHIIGEAAVQGPPDLVIEVLSPSTVKLDRGRKMGLYARAGVAEYWIVDPDNRSVEVYRLAGGAYRLELRAHEGDILRSNLFPGLDVSPAGLWR